jgi:dTDP-4-amino-4,6-dideoxygalactose transaminase
MIQYPHTIHLQPAYANLGYREGDLPEAERLAREIVSLPLYPELAMDEVRMIAQVVNEFK